MDLFSAKEAYKIARNKRCQIPNNLVLVINNAVNDGKYRVHCKELSDEIVEALKYEYGYDIKYNQHDDEWTISWYQRDY